jgi:hypothetical protein
MHEIPYISGKTNEARINEMEKEKQIMSQKHEQEIQELHRQMDLVVKMLESPQTALIKPVPLGLVKSRKRLFIPKRASNIH